ncbi:MAG: CPBP family intramembrane glutamic endopeptidase [Ktedonobacterales bacterium]
MPSSPFFQPQPSSLAGAPTPRVSSSISAANDTIPETASGGCAADTSSANADSSSEPFRPGPLILTIPGATEQQHAAPPARHHATEAALDVPLSTLPETWRWLWKDTLGRVAPFVLAAGLYARFSGEGAAAVGIRRDGILRDLALGTALGLPLAAIAAVFRAWVSPHYRLPTGPDQVAQTVFYIGINAPGEELFWRGTVQSLAIRGLQRTFGWQVGAEVVGWALTTLVFGAYHRLGGWSWRAIAGVTLAGGLFGATYLLPRGRHSILAPTLIHGFATAGFLSWGDVALHWRAERNQRRA